MSSYLVLPANCGGVPYLTPDALERIFTDESERLVAVSVFDAAKSADACAATNKSFAQFCGLENGWRTIVTLRSSLVGSHNAVPSNQAGVFGETVSGRVHVTPEKWTAIVAAAKPIAAVPLYDGCDDARPSKRKRTAEARTEAWVPACKAPADVEVLAPSKLKDVVGGSVAYVNELANPSPGEWLREVVACKPSFAAAPPSVDAILSLMLQGTRFIESSLPIDLAQRGCALTFALSNPAPTIAAAPAPAIIDLNDPVYRKDKTTLALPDAGSCPIAAYSLGYIHHLLIAHELNATILLALHNTWVLAEMFRRFRALGTQQERLAFAAAIAKQFDQ